MFYALFIADLLIAATFVWRFGHLPPQIPLFYSQAWGEDQLVDFWLIFILPVILHIFIFFNVYIYNRVFLADKLIKNMINSMNWFLIITVTAIFLKIILFVT
jgi:hypothetical protein